MPISSRTPRKAAGPARQALGPKFDLREFHDRVLENGSLTLGMLRQVIEKWIAEKKAGGA